MMMMVKFLLFLLLFVADIVSCVEFNHDGEFLATGDKGGRVVIFQRDAGVSLTVWIFKLDGKECVL